MSFQANSSTPIVQPLPANVQNLRRAAPNHHQMQEDQTANKRARMLDPMDQQTEMDGWIHQQQSPQNLGQAGSSPSNHQEGDILASQPAPMLMDHEEQLHPGFFQGPLVPTELLLQNQEADPEEPEGCPRFRCKKLERTVNRLRQERNDYKNKCEKYKDYKRKYKTTVAENEELKDYKKQCEAMAAEMRKLKEENEKLKKNGIAVLSPLTPDSLAEQQPSTSSSVPVRTIKEEPIDYEDSEPLPSVDKTAQWIESLLQDEDFQMIRNPNALHVIPEDGFKDRKDALIFLMSNTPESYQFENNNGSTWKSLNKTEKQQWKDSIKKLAAMRDEQVKVGLIKILNVDSIVPTSLPQLLPVQQ
ncbi:Protein CBG26182 [Caenorhabditis briggsae]|uniref:Protein CBG26182 n=2 Tax=Caenorhabditis briggsae TaxID=6238 RepID=B6ILS7_CAEBR|nr:Protein CBG26182 [Caenorhabditis briggsae]CAS00857.1 Protein CBG26182 [Caenorhabditis briggsae]